MNKTAQHTAGAAMTGACDTTGDEYTDEAKTGACDA